MEKTKIPKYSDIGDDFTEEQLIANYRALDSMKEVFDKMTPNEREEYKKWLSMKSIPMKLV